MVSEIHHVFVCRKIRANSYAIGSYSFFNLKQVDGIPNIPR